MVEIKFSDIISFTFNDLLIAFLVFTIELKILLFNSNALTSKVSIYFKLSLTINAIGKANRFS